MAKVKSPYETPAPASDKKPEYKFDEQIVKAFDE